MQFGLPHLYSKYKWYKWAREYFESTAKENFLCAANQISKSSTQIRKCIHWATAKHMWAELWPDDPSPNLFWYFYPDAATATREWNTKWKQFLPAGEFKEHEIYGWTEEWDKGDIKSVTFNSGVMVEFKTYSQKISNLQASTLFAIFCDEELPIDFLSELQFRLSASDGYFHMCFTATLAQEYWRLTIEPQLGEEEKHEDAFKLQISLYDCITYEDGTPSRWTEAAIEKRKLKCATQAEILKRIYGRFVKSEGLKYETYDATKNRTENHPLPKGWSIFSGVDIGSGGETGHKAAIVFVGVSPDYRKGRVFKAWRGDGKTTSAGDILKKYRDMREKLKCVIQSYDFASKEFSILASRAGESFTPAQKSHDAGEITLNTLFKHHMLAIQRSDPELDKLSVELSTLQKNTPKRQAKDDLSDALRYAVMAVPWDLSGIEELQVPEDPVAVAQAQLPPSEGEIRRGYFFGEDADEGNDQDELDEWAELIDS